MRWVDVRLEELNRTLREGRPVGRNMTSKGNGRLEE